MGATSLQLEGPGSRCQRISRERWLDVTFWMNLVWSKWRMRCKYCLEQDGSTCKLWEMEKLTLPEVSRE